MGNCFIYTFLIIHRPHLTPTVHIFTWGAVRGNWIVYACVHSLTQKLILYPTSECIYSSNRLQSVEMLQFWGPGLKVSFSSSNFWGTFSLKEEGKSNQKSCNRRENKSECNTAHVGVLLCRFLNLLKCSDNYISRWATVFKVMSEWSIWIFILCSL